MPIDLSPLVARVKGPIMMHNAPGYQFYMDPHGQHHIRRRRVGFGPAAQHPTVIFCQAAWNILDTAWRGMSRPQRTEWGRCLKRSSTLHRSNLDQFRSINLTRMLLGFKGMTTPHDAFQSRKVYLTTADRPAIPEGKRVPVWIEGKDKNGDPFPPPAAPIEPPDLPVPWPPYIEECFVLGVEPFNRPDSEDLGPCWLFNEREGNLRTWELEDEKASFTSEPGNLEDVCGQFYVRPYPTDLHYIQLFNIDWSHTESEYRGGIEIYFHAQNHTAWEPYTLIRVFKWDDEDFEIMLYIWNGDSEEWIDSTWTDYRVPDTITVWDTDEDICVECIFGEERDRFYLGPKPDIAGNYHGFGYWAEDAAAHKLTVDTYSLGDSEFLGPW